MLSAARLILDAALSGCPVTGESIDVRSYVDTRIAELDSSARRSAGGYDTPWTLADRLAEPPPDTHAEWWGDPCVGAGRLVVAALERWQPLLSHDRFVELVGRLRCNDIDARAARAARDATTLACANVVRAWVAAGATSSARALAEVERTLPDFARTDALDWLAQRSDSAVILTNPPFISIRSLHRAHGREYVDSIRARLPELAGAFDLGLAIAHAACRARGSGGTLRLVAPASWLSVDYARSLRDQAQREGDWAYEPPSHGDFDAAVHTVLLRSDGVGRTFPPKRLAERIGWTSVGAIASVSSGTPGFDAKSVADALLEAPSETEGWPFVTTASLGAFTIEPGAIRFGGRKLSRAWLPRAAVASPGRRTLYDEPKLLIPGIARELRCASAPEPAAMGIGVLALHDTEWRNYLLAMLNAPEATRMLERTFPGVALSGGYRRIAKRMLAELPVPDPRHDSWSERARELNRGSSERELMTKRATSLWQAAGSSI